MKVVAVLEAMPGVGKVRAQQIMERLEISPSRRVRGLGASSARRCSGSSAALDPSRVRAADGAVRPVRRRQGQRHRRGASAPPRRVAVGQRDDPRPRPGSRTGCSTTSSTRRSSPHGRARGAARARVVRRQLLRHAAAPGRGAARRRVCRCCSRSTCTARARCGRRCRRRSWSSWRRPASTSWPGGWSAGDRGPREGPGPAGPGRMEVAAEDEFDVVVVNDDLELARTGW
jgi:hypothetical protein